MSSIEYCYKIKLLSKKLIYLTKILFTYKCLVHVYVLIIKRTPYQNILTLLLLLVYSSTKVKY